MSKSMWKLISGHEFDAIQNVGGCGRTKVRTCGEKVGHACGINQARERFNPGTACSDQSHLKCQLDPIT
jgi:hypothetical protein